MLDRKELIKNFLLDRSISPEERRRRFEIAWDVRKNLETVELKLKQDLILKLKEKLEEEFKGYEVINNRLIEGDKWGNLLVFKKEWIFSEEEKIGILQYALEATKYGIQDLVIGIRKFDDDREIPFKGNWRTEQNLSSPLSEIINSIFSTLEKTKEGWWVDEWWIAKKGLREPYGGMLKKEFFLEIITDEGLEKVVDYFFQEFQKLKDSTEKLINKFVEEFKKLRKEN